MLIKDIYFGLQIALLILAGCVTSDMCYRGELKGIYAVVIILACVMAVYGSLVLYLRTEKKH